MERSIKASSDVRPRLSDQKAGTPLHPHRRRLRLISLLMVYFSVSYEQRRSRPCPAACPFKSLRRSRNTHAECWRRRHRARTLLPRIDAGKPRRPHGLQCLSRSGRRGPKSPTDHAVDWMQRASRVTKLARRQSLLRQRQLQYRQTTSGNQPVATPVGNQCTGHERHGAITNAHHDQLLPNRSQPIMPAA